ncbi:COPI-interacting protein CEX1 [Saccharomyces paradoxus]|uniref:COPI-interacting protein CEX1 n=1 Tax=Saccharomyces paradoxus TaxID=27291 RepID=A0A8B8UZQ2_SACPA|nr:Cex1 [Saccharomyces paradoxus]QHS76217.1 Cex1 [Saccharomyces paradoxus]
MNFSSIFKSISNFQFPYTIEETAITETAFWQCFDGTRKADSLPVTVFKAKRSPESEALILNAVHKAKILKIPGLCSVLETFDSDPQSTFIVTERVVPFPWDNLSSLSQNKFGIELGISQLLVTLGFLNKFVLGTLSKDSIYINIKGEWVLFGLELCSSKEGLSAFEFSSKARTYYNMTGSQLPCEDSNTIDSMGLGLLVKDLMTPSSLPKDWTVNVNMISDGRMTIESFRKRLENTETWRSNPLINFYQELKELHIKDPRGKLVVMSSLENLYLESREIFRNLTPGMIENFIIPELCEIIKILMIQSVASTASHTGMNFNASHKLVPFLAIVLDLTSETNTFPVGFNDLIAQSFKLPDRQVRFLLLIYLPKLIGPLSKSEISSRIYPHFIQGLTDSDATLRLQTLKTIPCIVSCLTERQLNNELLRFLAKTQVDSDIEIRTWTVIIISKISTILSTSVGNRSNILATAFTKSLKDPHVKPRLAALYGLEKSIELFDVNTIANKILTVIAPGLLDKSSIVRNRAKILFEMYLDRLEKEALLIQTNDSTDDSEDMKEIDFDNYGCDEEDMNKEDSMLAAKFLNNLRLNSPSATIPNNITDSEVDSAQDGNGWDDFSDTDGCTVNSTTESLDKLASHVITTNTQKFSGRPIKINKSWNDELNDNDWTQDESSPSKEPGDYSKPQASTLAKKIAPNSKLSIKKKKTTILAPRTIASSATAATKTSLSNKTARSKLASNVRASVINEKHVDSWDDDGDAESWDTNW